MSTDKTRIALIYAGGTIGSQLDFKSGGLKPVDFNKLTFLLPEIETLNVQITSFSVHQPKDSAEAGPEDWNELAAIILSQYEFFDGFVVLHGTDTMGYAASVLSFILEGLSKPVLFTGSQLPLNIRRSDGRENILTAIELASLQNEERKAIIQEVGILFHHKLYRGNRATKISTEHFDAFESPNYPPLAEIGVSIKVNDDRLWLAPHTKFYVTPIQAKIKIGFVTLFPGISAEHVKSVGVMNGLSALVLETLGAGNAPYDKQLLKEIRNLIEKGVWVINLTSCKRGSVRQEEYAAGYRLASLGVLSAFDLTREACIAKLYYLLSKTLSRSDFNKYWNQSLRGELTVKA